MTPFLQAYVATWLLACLLAAMLMWRRRHSLSLFQPGYRRFLGARWKLASFALAATGIVLVAPYTGDPTWDYVDAGFMAALTYATSPWSVGTLYLWLRGSGRHGDAYAAAVLWMFSASWSYDGYLLLRDGHYPETWLPNIPASSVLYCAAGLMWNLEWRPGRGVIFGFMREDWPSPPDSDGLLRVLAYALPFMLLAGGAILWFLV